MIDFDRKKDDLIPLKYKVGDKIMGYNKSLGCDTLVGGVIIGAEQSTSYLGDNKYDVKIEHELCEKDVAEGDAKITWWINEKEAMPFDQEIWNKAARHWLSHLDLKAKSYLEYIRMHRSLRRETDDISDSDIQSPHSVYDFIKQRNRWYKQNQEERAVLE